MSRENAALKLTCLLGPLAAAILSLLAWGEPLRAKADWYWMRKKYTEHRRIGFDIRVRKGSKVHESTAEKLGAFLDATLKQYGRVLALKEPRTVEPPLKITLLETEDHLKPHGFSPSATADHQGGRFVPDRWTIVLVVGAGAQHHDADERVLRHQMTHVLLHLAGKKSAAFSPWLEEGLAGYFEDFPLPSTPRPSSDPLPPLGRLLQAGPEELQATAAEDLRQGARLLVAFLLERHPDRFADYYREDLRPGPAPGNAFKTRVGLPEEIEAEWRDWAASLK